MGGINELQTIDLKDKEFKLLGDLVYNTIGINLGDSKKELLRTRLGKRLRMLGISSFKEYYHYVTEENKDELTNLFDAISTNLTSFFREQKHFDYLKDVVLPEITEEGANCRTCAGYASQIFFCLPIRHSFSFTLLPSP